MNDAIGTAEARRPSTVARLQAWMASVNLMEWIWLLPPMVLLGALALWNLGALSLWRDEVSSVTFAQQSVGKLIAVVGRDRHAVGLANMATYYLILHFWLALGEAEARIRLLSVLFGVASVVPVYFIARRMGGWLAAALAAGIYALIPYVIHYSQEARGYSLAMLVAGGLTWLLLLGVERRERVWPWLAYGLLAALGLYVHFFVALVVAAHGLWVLATRQVPSWQASVAALVPIILAAAPVPLIITQYRGAHDWISSLTTGQVVNTMTALTGSRILLVAMAVLVAVAVVRRRKDPRIWLVLASALVPILGAMGISLFKPMLVARYLVVSLPLIAVLLGVALAAIRPRVLGAVAAAGLAVALVVALPSAYADHRRQDWRGAAEWIAQDGTDADGIIAPKGREPVVYYLDQLDAGADPQVTSVQRTLDELPAQVWVVLAGGESQRAPVTDRLEPAYVVAERREFLDRLEIVRLERAPFATGGVP